MKLRAVGFCPLSSKLSLWRRKLGVHRYAVCGFARLSSLVRKCLAVRMPRHHWRLVGLANNPRGPTSPSWPIDVLVFLVHPASVLQFALEVMRLANMAVIGPRELLLPTRKYSSRFW